ncbi:peptide chain release factor-like protein [Candidatus Vidania fulgoroideorum]
MLYINIKQINIFELEKELDQIKTIKNLVSLSNNRYDIKYLKKELDIILINIKKKEKKIFFKNKIDCYMEIYSKKGGEDSSFCVKILYKQYKNFFLKEKIKYNIIRIKTNKLKIKKYFLILIKEKYEMFKTENGINKFIKNSKTKNSEITHTCYCSVKITPISYNKIVIKKEDIIITSFKASGAGGQHVNKTNSAVRIKHIPTNIIVESQNQRSQLQNKKEAMKILKLKIALYTYKKKDRFFNEKIVRIYFLKKNIVIDKRIDRKSKYYNCINGKIYENIILIKINENNRKNY